MSNPLYNPGFNNGFPALDPISILGGMTINNSDRGPLIDIPIGRTSASGVVRDATGKVIDFRPTSRSGQKGESVGDKAKKAGNDLLNKGKDAVVRALSLNPATLPFAIGAQAVGVSDGCGWLCQFQKWIADSGFFQRVALGVLAIAFIGVALTILGRGAVVQQVAGVAGNALKKTGKATA